MWQPSRQWWSAGVAPRRASYQAVPETQAGIAHTRPWLSLLAELCDTAPGCWVPRDVGCPRMLDACSARRALPAGSNTTTVSPSYCTGPIGSQARVMNHITWRDASTWSKAPLFSFHLHETVAALPRPQPMRQTSEHVLKQEKRPGPNFKISSRQHRPPRRPRCPPAGLSEPKG